MTGAGEIGAGDRPGRRAADRGARRTARLALRRPAAADTAWIEGLHTDPRNYPHSPDGAHAPGRARGMARTMLATWEREAIGYWIVEYEGEPVGMAGIIPAPLAGRACFNLYYRFSPAARGRGLAAEACREALVVAAEIDPERPVIVRTRPENGPARRLAATLGLTRRPDLDTDDGFVVYVSSW